MRAMMRKTALILFSVIIAACIGCNDNNNDWSVVSSHDTSASNDQDQAGSVVDNNHNQTSDKPEGTETKVEQNSNSDAPNEENNNNNDQTSNSSSSTESDKNDGDQENGGSEVGNETGSEVGNETVSGETTIENTDPNAAVSLEMPGLINLYRIDEHLYRSAQPTGEGLLSAQELGVETILSLQILNVDSALSEASQVTMKFEHVPMIPTSVSQQDVLDALRVIKESKGPVLVHCLHGADRTGTVVAMYRVVFQNWTKEAAKREMTGEKFGYHEEYGNLLMLIDEIDVEKMRSSLGL